MRNFFIAIVLLVTPTLALAARPPELALMKKEAPVGSYSFRKLMLHVYDISFWSDSGSWSKAPYALSITYDMHFSPDELAERTGDEMKGVSTLPPETIAKYTELLRGIYPQVKDGDRLTALQQDKETTVFYHNGKQVGVVKDMQFAHAFFGIWLSPKSSEPDMQKQLTSSNAN